MKNTSLFDPVCDGPACGCDPKSASQGTGNVVVVAVCVFCFENGENQQQNALGSSLGLIQFFEPFPSRHDFKQETV